MCWGATIFALSDLTVVLFNYFSTRFYVFFLTLSLFLLCLIGFSPSPWERSFCLAYETQCAFFKPRKLFNWVYFRLQSIWLAHSKCRALEIDDPFCEFIALIHISYAFCSKSCIFLYRTILTSSHLNTHIQATYIEVFDQARLFQKLLTISFDDFWNTYRHTEREWEILSCLATFRHTHTHTQTKSKVKVFCFVTFVYEKKCISKQTENDENNDLFVPWSMIQIQSQIVCKFYSQA